MTEYTPRHAKRNRFRDCLEEFALPLGILTGAIAAGAITFILFALEII